MVLRDHKMATLALALLTALVALMAIAPAAAANQADPRIDQVASTVAGHAVNIWCENDPAAYAELERRARAPSPTWGFADPAKNVAYISPVPCLNLHRLLDGTPVTAPDGSPGGPWWTADAIQILLHEATHLTGGAGGPFDCRPGTGCEGRTDCNALRLFPTWLPTFGISPTVTTTTHVTDWVLVKHKKQVRVKHQKRVRRHGKLVWKRWTTLEWKYWETYDPVDRLVTVTQPNPLYQQVLAAAQQLHDGRAKQNPDYKGDC
jgi:hypothetical protein